MKLIFIPACVAFSLLFEATAQVENSLWLSHNPLSNTLISKRLYPLEVDKSTQLTAAFGAFPVIGNMSNLLLGASFSLRSETNLGFNISLLSIGPYQERNIAVFMSRNFGKRISVFVKPAYQNQQVRAYPSLGGFLFQSGLKYIGYPFKLALVYESLVVSNQRRNLLLASLQRELGSNWVLGFHARQYAEMPWYFTVDASVRLDDNQVLQLGSGGRHFFFLRYGRKRGRWTMNVSLTYGAIAGLAPENGWSYAW